MAGSAHVLRAGDLRERVTIQQQARTPIGGGESEPTWTDVDTVWASVEPLTGREAERAGQAAATQPHRVRMRYRADLSVTVQRRLVWRRSDGDVPLHVVSVAEIGGRRRAWEFLTQANPDGGV